MSETTTGKSKTRKRKSKNDIDEHTQKSFNLSIKDITNLWIETDESDYNMNSLLKKSFTTGSSILPTTLSLYVLSVKSLITEISVEPS